MPRRDEVIAAMRDALQVQDPEWDISPGTPEWKIIEALGQQIENLTFNSVLNDFHFDVDKKNGLELDLFMSLFGYGRIRARRATGEVTFSRGTAALQDYIIPLGTQVFVPATTFNPAIYFQTTISAVLPTGATEVSVPVQSVAGGTIGNVGVGTIVGIATSIGGVTAVINNQAITGGRDSEADQDLRDRWRATVFRNISGTEDQFLALAFNESAFVTRANLVGPIERYSEQIQLVAPEDLTTTTPWEALCTAGTTTTTLTVSAGTKNNLPIATLADSSTHYYVGVHDGTDFLEIIKVTNRAAGSGTLTVVRASSPVNASAVPRTLYVVWPSSVTDSAYTYPAGGEVVGLDIGLTTQQVGRRGNDYELITELPSNKEVAGIYPNPSLFVNSVGATTFGLDSVIEMEHEYTPISSRNDPGDTRTGDYFSLFTGRSAEKVDLFVDGSDPLVIVEQIPFRHDHIFGVDVSVSDYLRDDGVNQPVSGNYFTQLSKSPIVSIPASITVPATATTVATTYYKDEDYWLVIDQTVLEGSPRSSNGIEWNTPLSVDDNAAYAAGTFSATVQATAGNLNGWYSYIVTYEVDGTETLSITDTPETAAAVNVSGSTGRNDLVVPAYVPGPAHSTIWRKIYRTTSQASQAAALAATHYLLKVVKDNTNVTFEDNKTDAKLDLNITPPRSTPPVDAEFSVDYSYNNLIERLDAQVDLVRLVGMDTLVHEADDIQLKFNLGVVVVPGMNISDLKADINTNLFAWIQRKSFQNNIQIADVIDQVSNSSGVDNVRLAREDEARNEVQKLTVTLPTTPSATRDQYTITLGDYTSGVITYNDTQQDVRETLEAMPNVHEGNTYATVTQNGGTIATAATTFDVTDNGSLHTDYDVGGPVREDFYVEIDNEIMYVESAVDNGATLTWTVRRAQLGTTAIDHDDDPGIDVHILGDVAVVRSTTGSPVSAYVYTIHYLPNLYTGVNDWGTRELDNLVATNATENSQLTLTVQERTSGSGWGIQKVAHNDLTIIDSFTTLDDIYLASDELPSLFAVDVIVKAQNSF